MQDLSGRTAVVTGGAGGIGLATAVALADAGASVTAVDVKESLGPDGRIEHVLGDIAAEATWERLAGSLPGGVDILVNAAGIADRTSLHESTLEDWDRVVAVNQTGTFLGCRFAVRSMLAHGRGGTVVNVSSIWGALATAGFPAYHATKGAIAVLTRNVAVSYAAEGIRANTVHPGLIDTPMSQGSPAEFNQAVVDVTPMRRIGAPEEVARLVLFLASDASSYITGQSLFVDGGFSII